MWRVTTLITAVVVVCYSPLGCRRTPRSTATTPSIDVEQLGMLCRIPSFVESVEWQVISHGDGHFGPSDYTLIARLHISAEGEGILDQCVTEASINRIPIAKAMIPDWLGDHRSLFVPSSVGGCTEAHCRAYTADLFYHSPYLNGVMLRPDRATVVIVLYTM